MGSSHLAVFVCDYIMCNYWVLAVFLAVKCKDSLVLLTDVNYMFVADVVPVVHAV